ncbi:hypothetical protein WN944_018613 [Citrus x changshan-huyou]|uniref:Uncharacterized protein n=1 Tax=Citrus x changshan-huyou TaxID=2935761 RepID=A0AAP0QIN9_9ROSI
MYEDRHMWAETFLRGHFFSEMRSTQRLESMNAYLNRKEGHTKRTCPVLSKAEVTYKKNQNGDANAYVSRVNESIILTSFQTHDLNDPAPSL